MSEQNRLHKPAAPLEAFSAGLGEWAPDWAAREEPDRIHYRREDFSRDVAVRLTLDHLLPLARAYGDALDCRFLLGNMPALEVTPDLDEADLASFRELTEDSPTVIFHVTLDKDALLESWLKDPSISPAMPAVPSTCRLFLYLFPSALKRLLTVPPEKLGELEDVLWPDGPGSKAIILVPDHDMWLDGPYLAVIGGGRAAEWRRVLPREAEAGPSPGDETEADENAHSEEGGDEGLGFIGSTRADMVKWDEPWVDKLTPLHLKLAGRRDSDDGPIAALLERHLVNLVVLYTADRSRRRKGPLWATYAGEQYTVELPLLRTENPGPALTSDGARALLQIFEWAYDPHFYEDKLPLAQIGVARALQAADAEVRPRLLVQNGPATYKGLRYHWKAFIESKVDAYVTQVRALEDTVDETAQAFADEVRGMIDELAKNVLAAVGVVVGSFIGSLFKESFNPLILSIGLGVYALYVYLLPLRLSLPHRWEAYEALRDAFEGRRERFEALLYKERVKEIVGDRIDESQQRFERWFARARRTYLDLIVAALVVAAVALAFALITGAGPTTTSPLPTPTGAGP